MGLKDLLNKAQETAQSAADKAQESMAESGAAEVLGGLFDKAKEAAKGAMDKMQAERAENQRLKVLPCAVCGQEVGGKYSRHQITGSETFICYKCWDKLPRSMKEYEGFDRFTAEDIKIGQAFQETYTEHFTMASTGFDLTSWYEKIGCDTDKGLFLVANHNIGRVIKPGPKTEVFRFDWLDGVSLQMSSPYASRHSQTGEIQHMLGSLIFDFDIILPGDVPPGLSIEIPPAPKKENHRIVLDSSYPYEMERKIFSNDVTYYEMGTVKSMREWFMDIWSSMLD